MLVSQHPYNFRDTLLYTNNEYLTYIWTGQKMVMDRYKSIPDIYIIVTPRRIHGLHWVVPSPSKKEVKEGKPLGGGAKRTDPPPPSLLMLS